jgi:hypothetical protein
MTGRDPTGKDKPMLSRLRDKIMGEGVSTAVSAGIGGAIAGPPGALAGAAAGMVAEEGFHRIVSAVTGRDKGSEEYQLFAVYLSEYLYSHQNREDGLTGITETSPEKLQPFEVTYRKLYENIQAHDQALHREVLMRGLARAAVCDADDDMKTLPNRETLISMMKQTESMTPRQIAIVAIVAENSIDSWADGSWWMETSGPDQSTVNDRRMYQEIFELTQGAYRLLTQYGPWKRKQPREEIPPQDWNEIDLQRLGLTRQGEDFYKVLQLENLSPEYKLSIADQLSPAGAMMRELRTDDTGPDLG